MKRITVLLFFMLWVQFAHSEAELEISAENCQVNQSTFLPPSMALLKKGNQAMIPSYHFFDAKVLVKDLEMGNYQLSYKTHFKTEESKTLEIKSDKKYTLKLCMDYLDANKIRKEKTLIEQLKSNEHYSINIMRFRFRGESETNLQIAKENDTYILSAAQNKHPIIRKERLSKRQIDALEQFEKELKHLDTGILCDHHSFFTFSYNGEENEFSDGCVWAGEQVLLKQLGIDNKKALQNHLRVPIFLQYTVFAGQASLRGARNAHLLRVNSTFSAPCASKSTPSVGLSKPSTDYN